MATTVPLAKQDSDYSKPNVNRKCANCLGVHEPRFLMCPYLQQCREALKISMTQDIIFKGSQSWTEAAWGITQTEKAKLQKDVNELKE